MNKKDYLKDISDIKSIMEKSSRFNALSSLSGIISGIYVLIGSFIAHQYVTKNGINLNQLTDEAFYFLFTDLAVIIALGLVSSIIITRIKSKKENINSWSIISKKMLSNFLIILIPSSIFIFVLIMNNDFNNAGALMLFLYGAALINASHNTYKEVKTLGLIEVILGTFAVIFPKYTFAIWVFGAGIVHIVFGILMYFKHDKK